MNDNRMMTDYQTPTFSTLIVDWLLPAPVEKQIDTLKLMGVPHDRREEYLQALAGRQVTVSTTSPLALTGSLPVIQEVDITPTMAIEGSPSNKYRPKPKVGSNLLGQPTVDLKKS